MKTPANSTSIVEIIRELESLGSPSYKKMLMTNHGVREPCFGVKISDLKKIQKRIKKDYQLALDLYDSGNYDAMYLAGLIADDARMTKDDLEAWAERAYGGSLPGYTVAWIAAESEYGWQLGLTWIESAKCHVAVTGWSTLAAIVALKPDVELDLPKLRQLIERVEKNIYHAPDAVRYAMNNFIIAVGCYVQPHSKNTIDAAERIGPVSAELGNNSCQIPFAPDYIRKAEARGATGKKRRSLRY